MPVQTSWFKPVEHSGKRPGPCIRGGFYILPVGGRNCPRTITGVKTPLQPCVARYCRDIGIHPELAAYGKVSDAECHHGLPVCLMNFIRRHVFRPAGSILSGSDPIGDHEIRLHPCTPERMSCRPVGQADCHKIAPVPQELPFYQIIADNQRISFQSAVRSRYTAVGT